MAIIPLAQEVCQHTSRHCFYCTYVCSALSFVQCISWDGMKGFHPCLVWMCSLSGTPMVQCLWACTCELFWIVWQCYWDHGLQRLFMLALVSLLQEWLFWEKLGSQGIYKYIAIYIDTIGSLQWLITLGRFDIATVVMTMAQICAAPWEGHVDQLKCIYGYLCKIKSGAFRVHTNPELHDRSGFLWVLWRHGYNLSFYDSVSIWLPILALVMIPDAGWIVW
jgi:hypothetical protein